MRSRVLVMGNNAWKNDQENGCRSATILGWRCEMGSGDEARGAEGENILLLWREEKNLVSVQAHQRGVGWVALTRLPVGRKYPEGALL